MERTTTKTPQTFSQAVKLGIQEGLDAFLKPFRLLFAWLQCESVVRDQ